MGKVLAFHSNGECVYPTLQSLSTGVATLFAALPMPPHKEKNAMPPETQAARIAVLETKVNSFNENIREINNRLTEIQKVLEERTLPVNSITWKALFGVSGAVFSLLVIIASLYHWSLSNKFTVAGAATASVQDNLNQVKGSLEKKMDRSEFIEWKSELKEYMKLFIKTGDDVKTTTTKAVTAPRERLGYTLSVAQSILSVAKEKGIPLDPKQIQQLAEPLRRQKFDDPILAHTVQDTLSALASYRTFSDSKLQPISRDVIEKAKANGAYFEGVEVILGSREVWEGAVFKDCVVITGTGSAKLALKNVSFSNCTLKQNAEIADMAGAKLVAAIIDSPTPVISIVLYDFPVSNSPGMSSRNTMKAPLSTL